MHELKGKTVWFGTPYKIKTQLTKHEPSSFDSTDFFVFWSPQLSQFSTDLEKFGSNL